MGNGKRALPIALLVSVLFGIALLAVLVLPAVSEGDTSGVSVVATDASGSTTDSPSPTATPTPPPASSATVAWAHKQRNAAHRAWLKYRRAAKCFHKHVDPFLTVTPRYPPRSAPEDVWRAYGQRYHNKRHVYLSHYQRLRQKMLHPGGSSNGVRWMPLARWVGWPESTLGNLAYIIMRESSGRERAYNSVIGCSGLLQIWPGNLHAGESREDLFHAEFNLRIGLRLYHECGWSPWAL